MSLKFFDNSFIILRNTNDGSNASFELSLSINSILLCTYFWRGWRSCYCNLFSLKCKFIFCCHAFFSIRQHLASTSESWIVGVWSLVTPIMWLVSTWSQLTLSCWLSWEVFWLALFCRPRRRLSPRFVVVLLGLEPTIQSILIIPIPKLQHFMLWLWCDFM